MDRSLGDRKLTALIQKLERNMHLTRGQPLGITVASISARYRTSVNYRRLQHGGYCVWLDTAKVTVRLENLTVYMDRKYESDSCEYNAILKHEMTHVALNRAAVKAYLPQVKQALAKAVRAKPYIRVLGTARQAKDAYLIYLRRKLAPVLRAMEAQRSRKNAHIDTPDSYREIMERCKNW